MSSQFIRHAGDWRPKSSTNIDVRETPPTPAEKVVSALFVPSLQAALEGLSVRLQETSHAAQALNADLESRGSE